MQHLTDKTRHLAHAAQRGAILIPAVAALLVCVVLLGAAQLGLYFSVKRDLQNVVDLAALNNVVLLDNYRNGESACHDDMQAHVSNYIGGNTKFLESAHALAVSCKRVIVSAGGNGSSYMDADPDATGSFSAIDVSLKLEAKDYAFFGSLGLENISASSTAYLPPIDEFLAQQRFRVEYVGAQINDGLLGLALSTVGLSPEQLRVLSSEGLVNVHLTPSGLLEELGIPVEVGGAIGSPNDLLNLQQVEIGSLLQAAVAVLQKNSVAGVDLGILESAVNLMARVDGFKTKVPLFGDGGFLQIADSGSVVAALATQIQWGDLLNTSVYLANSDNLLDLDLDLGLEGLLNIEGRVLLVEPPASAPLIKGNTATHANARIYLRVGVLAQTLDLPIILEVGQGSARVEHVEFNRATVSGYADFSVNGSLLNVCMGRFDAELFSPKNSCSTAADFAKVRPHRIINLLGLLPVNAKLALSILSRDDTANSAQHERVELKGRGPYAHTTHTANLDLPGLVEAVVDGIVFSLLADISGGSDPMTNEQKREVAAKLIDRNGKKKSVGDVVKDIRFSAVQFQNYSDRIVNNPLLGFLGSTLDFTGDVLKLVLPDLGCTLAGIGGRDALYDCREKAVRDLVLGSTTSRIEYVVVELFSSVLNPLLTPLNTGLNRVLGSVFDLLGLDVGVVEITIDEFSSAGQFEGVLIHSKRFSPD